MNINTYASLFTEPVTWLFKLLLDAASVLIIVFVALLAQRVTYFFINRYFTSLYNRNKASGKTVFKKRYNTLANAFRQVTGITIWSIAAFAILAQLGVNYTALLASAGALGLFLGIAAKDAIMDIYNGFMVLVEDQYRVGDIIEATPAHVGTVENITLRTVILRDIEGSLHIVPHHLATAVINKTYDYAFATFELNLPQDANIHKVQKLIDSVGSDMSNDPKWKKFILTPLKYIQLLSFDDTQVTIRVSGKVQPGKQWEVSSEFRTRLKDLFDKKGIDTPFPERTTEAINQKSVKQPSNSDIG